MLARLRANLFSVRVLVLKFGGIKRYHSENSGSAILLKKKKNLKLPKRTTAALRTSRCSIWGWQPGMAAFRLKSLKKGLNWQNSFIHQKKKRIMQSQLATSSIFIIPKRQYSFILPKLLIL